MCYECRIAIPEYLVLHGFTLYRDARWRDRSRFLETYTHRTGRLLRLPSPETQVPIRGPFNEWSGPLAPLLASHVPRLHGRQMMYGSFGHGVAYNESGHRL